MHEPLQHFVEKMGLVCEKEGMARIAGRVFGLLLADGTPLSLDEIADRLQVSKASVSTNARMLEQLGLVERVSAPGDRRDFYQVEVDPWERMLRVAQTRWREMVCLFAEARESLCCGRAEGMRDRLEAAERFHALLIEESDRFLDRWRERRDGGGSAADGEDGADADS